MSLYRHMNGKLKTKGTVKKTKVGKIGKVTWLHIIDYLLGGMEKKDREDPFVMDERETRNHGRK